MLSMYLVKTLWRGRRLSQFDSLDAVEFGGELNIVDFIRNFNILSIR